MASLNRVNLLGNLGADVDLRYTSTGKAVCSLRVATNEFFKNTAGETQKKTEWHQVVVWGKAAEACSKCLSKGRQVMVEGRLQTRQWKDKEGVTRYTTEVVANRVQFLGGNPSKDEAPAPEDTSEPETVLAGDEAPVGTDDIQL